MNKNITAVSNTGRNIIFCGMFQEIYASDKYIKGVSAYCPDGKPCEIATYDTLEANKFALELLLNAMLDDEEVFEFPHKRDLEEMMTIARQHGSKVTSRKTGHGGS